tara:strand:- start:2597 stop:3295 length:699 start_codon:yes stop_codon:yes gene_type:complete
MNNDLPKLIEVEKFISWGLYPRIYREYLIDKDLLSIKEPSKSIQNKLLREWCKHNGVNSQESLDKWLEKNFLNQRQLESIIIRRWRWIQFCRNKFKNKLSTYFLERKDSLDLVTYSLLRVKDKGIANEFFLRIKEKESTFHEIASRYSEGPERKVGGLIGPVEMTKPHPVLAKILRESSPKQLQSPFIFEKSWIIVRLEKLIKAQLDEKTSIRLYEELSDKYLKEQLIRIHR